VSAGIVTFDFPPQYKRADVAVRPTATDSPVIRLLRSRDLEICAPVSDLALRDPGAAGGIRDGRDLETCIGALSAGGVECLVVEVFHWARISLVADLVGRLDLPTAVVAVTGEGWNGVPCAGAICGSLREMPGTRAAALLEVFLDSDAEGLLRWVAGASAYSRMRKSRVMLWGGSYGAEMPYTRSDPAALESFFLGEVMYEAEEVLAGRAERIRDKERGRVDAFHAWIKGLGAQIVYDDVMATPAALDFQVSLYLAARDRLRELGGGEGSASPGLAAASIKCHYEMSLSCQGCTACLLPAFLPFGVDAEGPQAILPFVCEGDLNGAATAALLHQLCPEVPPLFGDLVSYGPDHVLLRNCGASSVYWAGRSSDAASSLSKVRLSANLHGRSGAALGYETPPGGAVTFARLFREQGRFGMLLGEGKILAETPGSRYADPWPHTRLDLGVDTRLLFKAMPCNHGTLTEGALASEIETACAYAGVPVFRCDGDAGLHRLIAERAVSGKDLQ